MELSEGAGDDGVPVVGAPVADGDGAFEAAFALAVQAAIARLGDDANTASSIDDAKADQKRR